MPLQYDLTYHVTGFCRALREHGLLVGQHETADAMRAMSIVDLMDRGRVYWTLRSLLLSRREEIAVFGELFEYFWNFESQPCRAATLPGISSLVLSADALQDSRLAAISGEWCIRNCASPSRKLMFEKVTPFLIVASGCPATNSFKVSLISALTVENSSSSLSTITGW